MGIESLLRPRSIAIVGASDKVGPGLNAWNALQHVGFEGQVHLVNPRRAELLGQKAHARLADIPGTVDAVFVAVGAEAVAGVAREAVAKGAGALVILSSGFGETGPEGVAAQAELVEIARAHDLAVCGPNCLGLLNFAGKTALFGTSLPDQIARGGIAAVLQSGSVGIALLNSARGLGFSYVVTSGNEAVTTAADYIEAFLDDPAVTTIVVFAEQIKKPQHFIAALRRARAKGKPVIVLKSGRSAKGQEAVKAHTGAVAGSVEACDAALADAGAIQVFSLDELIETALLVSQLAQLPTGRKAAALSLSGGEIALALDMAEEVGFEFAPIAPSTAEELARLLPDYAHIGNPLDLTWAGLYDPEVARGCARAITSQDDVGLLVLLQDAPFGLGAQQAARYSALLKSVAAGARDSSKPLVALSNLSDQPHVELNAAATALGVPYLRGTRAGMMALSRYGRWAAAQAPVRAEGLSAHAPLARARMSEIPATRLATEREAKTVLAAYGIAGPRELQVTTAEAAVEAAQALGYPVVLKGLVENLVHKSDAGLVKVGLKTPEDVRAAAARMLEAAAAVKTGAVLGLLVQEQASPIAELFIGGRTDPDFGPLIVMGAGGVEVELYKDVAVRLAPITPEQALDALCTTQVSRLLDGWRGKQPADKMAVAQIISALSTFLADFSEEISEVEINPLAVFAAGSGCSALDCVIIPKPARPD
ncbi:acetate--CoA ligase family protein [Xanthobacter sp. VTT E-85241]|uniref:acetate--CoA ligase family protein n=1 Tax=Roseixanthobacter finlandensis TaxID=3119922 RepID=UPI00372B8A61